MKLKSLTEMNYLKMHTFLNLQMTNEKNDFNATID